MNNRQEMIRRAAESLWIACQTKVPTDQLTVENPDLMIEGAYEIQRLNINKQLEAGKRMIGKKIGLTSKPMQHLLGVNEPDFGCLLDDMLFADRAEIPSELLLQPKVEGEIAFVLKKEISGPSVSVRDVLSATDYILPALEIVDSRVRDWKIKLADTVADNASSGLIVLGERGLRPTDLDMRLTGMVLMVNDQLINTGAGGAALGHPALCVAWLARKLSEFGDKLRAGDVILSGALSAAVSIQKGDRFEAAFDRLGHVSGKLV